MSRLCSFGDGFTVAHGWGCPATFVITKNLGWGCVLCGCEVVFRWIYGVESGSLVVGIHPEKIFRDSKEKGGGYGKTRPDVGAHRSWAER